MFKDSKTKPKYSIRKYSIGAASALIGLMTLVHGQVVHADEAQSISDLTNASNQAQAPQTASTAQLATSEPTSEIVQTSQPANIMPSQPKVTTVQPAEQTPTIDQMVETGTSQNQETSANVLTNATEDQGQGKEYNTDNYGAKMPYTSHEAENATIENGATIQQSTDMESTAVEATNQTYVELPKKDAAVTFNVTEPANALNMRYTIPDGASGQLDVQVNGSSVGNLDLSSHSAWQYLKGDHEYDQAIDGSSARFRFDETRLLLKDIQLKSGDKISLVKKKDDNVPYGIDFIELEQAPAPVAQSENSISIVDKGASANDDSDDTAALLAAVEEAKASGKSVYIPVGRFNFDKQVNIEADNLKISGAGVWHTQLHFTSDKRYGGGIVFGHNSNGIELSNLYMDSNLTSRYKEDAQYKAISGTLGKDSHIHDVWVQHFEVGMWIGDYDQTGNMKYTDGLVVENTRIRNNLADGINFAQGTKNSTVKNSIFVGMVMMVWQFGQAFQMGQMPQLRKIINSSTTPLKQVGVRLVSVFLVVRGMRFQETSSRTSLLEQVFVLIRCLLVIISTIMILELRYMTILFYVQEQLMTSITSTVVPLISNKFVGLSRMSMFTIISY